MLLLLRLLHAPLLAAALRQAQVPPSQCVARTFGAHGKHGKHGSAQQDDSIEQDSGLYEDGDSLEAPQAFKGGPGEPSRAQEEPDEKAGDLLATGVDSNFGQCLTELACCDGNMQRLEQERKATQEAHPIPWPPTLRPITSPNSNPERKPCNLAHDGMEVGGAAKKKSGQNTHGSGKGHAGSSNDIAHTPIANDLETLLMHCIVSPSSLFSSPPPYKAFAQLMDVQSAIRRFQVCQSIHGINSHLDVDSGAMGEITFMTAVFVLQKNPTMVEPLLLTEFLQIIGAESTKHTNHHLLLQCTNLLKLVYPAHPGMQVQATRLSAKGRRRTAR